MKTQETKVCNGLECNGKAHPLTDFYKDRSRSDGLAVYCKMCKTAYEKRYVQTESGREARRRAQRKFDQKDSEKKRKNDWWKTEQGKRYRKKIKKESWYKAAKRRYEKSEKGKQATKRYRVSEKGRKTRRPILQNYRAKKNGGGGSFTVEEFETLCNFYDNKCLCCGTPAHIKPLTADHVVPVSKYGSSYIENIQPLCQSCNSSKGDKTIDYRKRKMEWPVQLNLWDGLD